MKIELQTLRLEKSNRAIDDASSGLISSENESEKLTRSQSSRDFSLASAMSALSSIVHMVENQQQQQQQQQQPQSSSSLLLSSSKSPEFLSGGDENASDFEFVVLLIKSYLLDVTNKNFEFGTTISDLKTKTELLQNKISEQDEIIRSYENGKKENTLVPQNTDAHPKISFQSFAVGDIAFFFPMKAGSDIYVAFNSACPCRFLSPHSLNSFRERAKAGQIKNVDFFVIGKIVYIETHTASNINLPNSNPFNLSIGTEYHLVDVDPEINGIVI